MRLGKSYALRINARRGRGLWAGYSIGGILAPFMFWRKCHLRLPPRKAATTAALPARNAPLMFDCTVCIVVCQPIF